MGRLVVVATPIGNLADVTQRAVAALRDADVVLAEDTRRTRALLTHLDITHKEVARLDAQVEATGLERVLARLDDDAMVALVSDAGTPAISDPGARLVREAARLGHEVVSLPGASAVTTAIAASGFGGTRFRFFGFLPRKGRKRMLDEIAATNEIVVFFEAPARMAATLGVLADRMGQREALIARELTKKHEELIRGALDELAAREAERRWRGEITVVLGPMTPVATAITEAELDALIDAAGGSGERDKEVAKRLAAESGWSSRDVYRRIVERKG